MFWDGTRVRRADPVALYRNLRNFSGWNMDDDLELVVKNDPEACSRAIDATRHAFEVQPLGDKTGLTEDETLDVLAGYLIWVEALKKNSNPSATSPEPTEPSLPSSGSGPTMRQSADCILTSPARSSAGPAA